MRIVALIPSLRIGGAERSLVKLLNVIAPWVQRVDLICLSSIDSRVAAQLPAGVAIYAMNARSSASPWLWLKVARRLRALRPDVVIGWSTYANLVAVLASRLAPSARVVLSERNYMPQMLSRRHCSPLRRAVVITLIRWLYPMADVVTANSRRSTRFLKRYLKGRSEFCTLPNAVEIAHLKAKADEAMPQIEWGPGPRIVAIGRLDYQKGFDVLLRAWAIVRPKRPEWELALIGDGPEGPALRALCADLGIEPSVHWLGETDNPFPYYKWADIVVVPSRFEGFPNVPLEAMALGKAVICSDCRTGPRELTCDGQYGWLVPVNDSEKLAQAILAAGASPQAMREMGRRAQSYVLSTYEAAAVECQYLAALGVVASG